MLSIFQWLAIIKTKNVARNEMERGFKSGALLFKPTLLNRKVI